VALVITDVSEERIASIIGVDKISVFHYVLQLLVSVKAVPSSLILITLKMEAIRSSETSVLTRAIERHMPEDCILHSRRHENQKSYIALTGWIL
jgi:hypothetical protein